MTSARIIYKSIYNTISHGPSCFMIFSSTFQGLIFLHACFQCFLFFLFNNRHIFHLLIKWNTFGMRTRWWVIVNISNTIFKSLWKLTTCYPTFFFKFRFVIFMYTTMVQRTDTIATLILIATVLQQGIAFLIRMNHIPLWKYI